MPDMREEGAWLMTWVKLDDGFAEHAKVLKAGPLAAWLHVSALCYANRHLTDGLIPQAALSQLMSMNGLSNKGRPVRVAGLAARLVRAGLWERDGGDYRIHDYLDYQPSRREVETRRAQLHQVRCTVGAQGGQQTRSKRTASVQPRPVPSRPVPNPTPPPQPPPNGQRSPLLEAVIARRPGAHPYYYDAYTALEDEYGTDFMWGCYKAALESGKTEPSARYLEGIARRCKAEGREPNERQELQDAEPEGRPDDRPTEIDGLRVIGWVAGLPILDAPAKAP